MKNKIITVLASIYALISAGIMSGCGSQSNNDNNTADESQENKEWHVIKPTELKNPVELFDKDWMALAVGNKDDMNAMTIGWGEIGELWERPVVTVYVSSSRYTHSFMERNEYFTVTSFPRNHRPALQYIGTHSGRDGDKLKAAGLTPEFTTLGNPIFKEANLAIECRIIYSAPFDPERMDSSVRQIYDKGSGIHTMYIGEIVNVWKK